MSWFSKPAAEMLWLRLHFDHQLPPASVSQFIRSVLAAGGLGLVVFEAEATGEGLIFRIGAERPGRIRQLLGDFASSITVDETARELPGSGSAWRVVSSTDRRPLRIDDLEAASLGLLGALKSSKHLASGFQVVVGDRLNPNPVPDKLQLLRGNSWPTQLGNAALGRTDRIEGEAHRAMSAKQNMPGARVALRLFAHGDVEPPRSLPMAFLGSLRAREASGVRLDLRRDDWRRVLTGVPGKRPLALNVDELTTVLGWPYGERSYPGVDRERSATKPAHKAQDGNRILGHSTHPGPSVSVGYSPVDGLRHTHVLGPSGVGKSTLLLNLIVQDINAGRAAVVIEPKGDLVDDVLARVDEQQLERIVVIDPGRKDFVVGFNPLVGLADVDLAVDGILHIFRTLNHNSWGPRTQDILHASLLTLAVSDQNSLVHVPDLLSDHGYRSQVLNSVKLRAPLAGFWRWFQGLSDGERTMIISPVLNKLRPFTLRPNLHALLSAPEPFDLSRVYTDKTVLLVPLRVGSLGWEVAHLVGALLMAQLWQLTQGRTAIPHEKRHPVTLYADEFQSYTKLPTDFGDVLAQARGLGLGMVLAHQNLHQLDSALRSVVQANVQNRAYFRLSSDDATGIAKHIRELRAEDFIRLPRYEIYAQLLRDAEAMPICSVRTEPPAGTLRDPLNVGRELAQRDGVALADLESDPVPPTAISDEDLGDVGRRAKRGAKK